MDIIVIIRLLLWRWTAPSDPGPSHYGGFTITLRHTPHFSGRVISPTQIPLPDNKHTHERQTSMPRRDTNPQF
jgi:hypothetical protein